MWAHRAIARGPRCARRLVLPSGRVITVGERARAWRMSQPAVLSGTMLMLTAAAAMEACAPACACRSGETAWQMWRTHRAARRMAVSLEQGALDNSWLDNAMQELSTAIGATRQLRDHCSSRQAASTACSYSRRSCYCRPHQLLNVTRTVGRTLDDAAAGVLFGDGEDNMLKLSNTVPYVLRSLSRVASELDRLSRRCPTGRARHGVGDGERPSHLVEESAGVPLKL